MGFSIGILGVLLFFGLYIVASSLDKIADAQKATAEALNRIAERFEPKS